MSNERKVSLSVTNTFLIFLCLILSCGFLDLKETLQGTSLAQSGIIKVYEYSKNSTKQLLGEGSLENGKFKIPIAPNKEIILITLESFSIFDYINNINVVAGEEIRWETFITSLDFNKQYNINPVTNLAAGLIRKNIVISMPENNKESIQIIQNINESIGKHFGDIEITKTVPCPLDTTSNTLSDEIKYSLILKSFIEIPYYYSSNPNVNFNQEIDTVTFTKSIYDDIFYDNYLDSIAAYGSTILSIIGADRALKSDLALSLYRLIQNTSVNRTGLTTNDAFDFLDRISFSSSNIFRENSPSYPFDVSPPSIACSSPINGEIYNGIFEIDCHMNDPIPGVEETRIKINHTYIENDLNNHNHFYTTVDTQSIGGSSANIEISSRDNIGNQNSHFITILIENR